MCSLCAHKAQLKFHTNTGSHHGSHLNTMGNSAVCNYVETTEATEATCSLQNHKITSTFIASVSISRLIFPLVLVNSSHSRGVSNDFMRGSAQNF